MSGQFLLKAHLNLVKQIIVISNGTFKTIKSNNSMKSCSVTITRNLLVNTDLCNVLLFVTLQHGSNCFVCG